MPFTRNAKKQVPEVKKPWDFSGLRDRFRKVLEQAIAENKQYNILHGAPAKGVGEMKLYQTNRGGSLVVGIESHDLILSYLPDMSCGYSVIQLNFGPEDNQIHITMANLSYLTVLVNAEAEIDGVAELIREKVAKYRLFTE